MGRKSKPEHLRKKGYSVNLTDSQKALIDRACEIKEWEFAQYLRNVAVMYAKKILEEEK